ncbi:zf-HC2 domain-containing protein [Streptomyces argenteolus]|uniref:Zf-HC2 domain-containing protein n=1 Tax=Streptomyces argenteolus TaxID=67274 RepID=A0ABW6X6I8_9ACTN
MPAIEPHVAAGAYALGVLGAADACRFEQHLVECPACVVQVRELGGVADVLAAFARLLPPGGLPPAARWRR